MTDQPTPRLALPLLQPGQSQKEMYHNEALARLDLAVQPAVIAAGGNIPPESAEPGDCWIIGSAPEGAWAGHAKAVAGWTEAGWRFLNPREGMVAWIVEDTGFGLFSGGNWRIGEAYGRLIVDGEQVVGPRAEAVMDPEGGTIVDAEARIAVVGILEALREHGLLDPG